MCSEGVSPSFETRIKRGQDALATKRKPMAQCWCGNAKLDEFSNEYARCAQCETLVSLVEPAQADPQVRDDAADYYGQEYWLSRQQSAYGLPPIQTRAR